MELRPYQKQAVEATIKHFSESADNACVVLPTGAGKSLVIAELARKARGRVVIVAHVKELCAQNYQKFLAVAGRAVAQNAGIYSAGLKQKDASKAVTFASIQSISRNLQEFGQEVSLLIVDECHRVSGESESQYSRVIEHLRSVNPRLKVLGLTATPYRMGMGWCYRYHHRGLVRTDEARPFEKCVYEVSLHHMVKSGYLTTPQIEDAPIAQYDFSALGAGPTGQYASDEVNGLLVRQKRVTQAIVDQVVERSNAQKRKGVMIFAATVQHAHEIVSYLPPEQTALIIGETDNDDRDRKIRAFHEQKFRYLVNVSVLTTGFDAPHVDFIALLRPTQSVSLFQQIVGRGLRLFPGKEDCLVVDYAGNGFDVYSPEVGEKKPTSDSVAVEVPCPICHFDNEFWGRKDEDGHVFEHFGRRCQNLVVQDDGRKSRCAYRFRFKECERCHAENDIAARTCHECEAPIVDPDDQLKKALRLSDSLVLRVASMSFEADGTSIKIVYHDEEGTRVREKFDFAHRGQLSVFNRIFSRRLANGRSPLELTAPEHVLQLQGLFQKPDFVVARKQKSRPGRRPWFRVSERVFDYEGRYRKAYERP